MKDTVYNIGKYIKMMLAKRDMPKYIFAKELGTTPQYLTTLLNDNKKLTVIRLQKVCSILNVPSDFLLQDVDKMFLIYAIDDYLGMIDKLESQDILNKLQNMLNNEEIDNG